MESHNEKQMLSCDFHSHTGFSDDCDVSADEMLKGAAAAGIKTLAVTDHYDPGYIDPEFPFTLDFDGYHSYMAEAREKYMGVMDIRIGMEIGIMEGHFDEANEAIDSFPHDVIIGSFHSLRSDDLYRYDFSDVDGPAMLKDFYTYVYSCLRSFTNYDIAGHLSILDRYIGKLYDYEPLSDILDEILKLLVHEGKGLEINTSSFRYGTGAWLPRESILRRYHELGGEILTFGSDAHSPEYYRFHFNDAVELARSIGFRYYCTFKDRKPEFFTLP